MSRWDDFVLDHPRVAERVSSVRRYLPPLNFITIHYAYFLVVCLISSIVFWGSSDPASSVGYADSLFLVVSAMTEAGLNTVNLSTLTTWQQAMLFLLIMLGSTIWVSTWIVLARKHVFQRRFDDISRAQRVGMPGRHGSTRSMGSMGSIGGQPLRRSQTVPTSNRGLPIPSNRKSEEKAETPVPDVTPGLGKQRQTSRGVLSLPELHHVEPYEISDAVQSTHGPVEPSNQDGHVAFDDAPHPRQQGANIMHASPSTINGDEEEPTERGDPGLDMKHFLRNHPSGRHGEFHGLTSEQRQHLGGCEYRALSVLSVVVPLYFFLWQLLGCIALGAWINHHAPDTAKTNGINPWWLGIFNGVSAFNNSGMSLLDENMVPFQNAYFVLITMALMVLAGNTAYPLILRFVLWACLRILKATTREEVFHDLKIALEFILKYPRRVYTNLFPSRPTWWLCFMLICLNSVDWVAFELLNIGNRVIEAIPIGSRILDGLFQALAVRSGGFYVVPISQIAIGVQFLYVIMMYISVYPIVITMRHSNVYEERSLGIYHDEEASATSESTGDISTSSLPSDDHALDSYAFTTGADTIQPTTSDGARRPTFVRRLSQSVPAAGIGRVLQRTFTSFHGVGVPPRRRGDRRRNNSPSSRYLSNSNNLDNRVDFIRQQVHGQLAHDIWWLVLAALVITMIETSHFNDDPVVFSVFNIIFEVVSAYGTVGISVGVPTAAYSFCGAWHTASKLVLCLVMLRGRHRGLPVALDHAVRLPGEHLHREEEEDHRIRRSMSERRMS